MTGLENSQNPPKQSDVTLKAITISSLAFSRMLSKSLFYCHRAFLFIFFLIRAVIRQEDSLHSPPRCDSSRRLAPLSQLIRRNTKTNQDLIARVFLGFGQFAWFYFEFSWLFVVITLVVGLRYSIEKCCPF